MLPSHGPPPPPAPVDYPGARRTSSSPDRRQGEREGRSRTAEGPRHGAVRRIRSTGPLGPSERAPRLPDGGMATCGGFRPAIGRSMTTARRIDVDSSAVRELEEMRARTAQMEKTLRWWSDCTANWRDKWTKVRIEKNKAVEEARLMKRDVDRLEFERDRLREENASLREELCEMRARYEDFISRGDVRIEGSIARNFGIMNNFFLSLNEDADHPEDNAMCSHNPWQMPVARNESHPFSPYGAGYEKKDFKDIYPADSENCNLQARCKNLFDSDDEAFENDFFGELRRPKSSGTLPKSRKFLSSNMSDPCLLSCTEGSRLKNPSPDNPSTGDQSTTTSDMNSLDSGITDEGSAQKQSEKSIREPRKLGSDPSYEVQYRHQTNVENRRSQESPPHLETLKKEFEKQETELKSLKNAHGKLQEVLTDKGAELGNAVRRAEAYEREARKLRHKLDELRKHQKSERSVPTHQKQVEKIHLRKQSIQSSKKDSEKQSIRIEALNKSEDGIYDSVNISFEKSDEEEENEPDVMLENIYDTPAKLLEQTTDKVTERKSVDMEFKEAEDCDDYEVPSVTNEAMSKSLQNSLNEAENNNTELQNSCDSIAGHTVDAVYACVNKERKDKKKTDIDPAEDKASDATEHKDTLI